MFNLWLGFLSGLSVGIYCLGLCLPIFLPILLSRRQTTKSSFLLVLEFSLGRLIGYLFFGFLFGWLGSKVKLPFVHTLAILTNLWLGVLMVLHALGMINSQFCLFKAQRRLRWPLVLGFLTGVNICPPFLASLSYVFSLKNTFRAVLYFLSFFVGTSAWLIPTGLFGITTKIPIILYLGRLSGIFVGIYFIFRSLIWGLMR